MFQDAFYKKFNQALGECLSRLRDVSLRDGQQSWDANRLSNRDTLDILKEYNEYAKLVLEYTGYEIPPVELSGGGEYLQPARFMGENPFENLRTRAEIAPLIKVQSLYRGRQGFGFIPASDEIQYYAIYHSAALGNKVLRSFDMMNDFDNLVTSIRSFYRVRLEQSKNKIPENERLCYELALSYMSAPSEGGAALNLDDYARMATDFILRAIHIGTQEFHFSRAEIDRCLSFVYKDYGGQITDENYVFELINKTHQAFYEKGLETIKINLHSHSHKPKLLLEAMRAGAYIVDTAIGDFAKGPSHTDMIELLSLMMNDKGFDIEDKLYKDHPILLQLSQIKEIISEIAKIHIPYRMPLEVISEEEIIQHKIALGAASALWELIQKRWHSQIKPQIKAEFLSDNETDNKVMFYRKTLSHIYNPVNNTGVWWDGGQFNTVTPGSTIAYDQALLRALSELSGRELAIGQHNQAYKNIVMGRYGKNYGLDKGLGDIELRKAYFLEAGIDFLKSNSLLISEEDFEHFLISSQLSELIQDSNKFSLQRETILRNGNLDKLIYLVMQSYLPQNLKDKFLSIVTSKSFATTEDGLAKGREQVTLLEQEGIIFSDKRPKFGLSERDESALLIMLTFTTDKGFEIGKNVLRFQEYKGKKIFGEIEPPRYGDILALVGDEIDAVVEDMAKLEVLEQLMAGKTLLSQDKILKTKEGITILQRRFHKALREIISKLHENDYSDNPTLSFRNIKRAKDGVRHFSIVKKDMLKTDLEQTPPAIWNKPIIKKTG